MIVEGRLHGVEMRGAEAFVCGPDMAILPSLVILTQNPTALAASIMPPRPTGVACLAVVLSTVTSPAAAAT